MVGKRISFTRFIILMTAVSLSNSDRANALLIDFEELTFPSGGDFENGEHWSGSFISQEAEFNNHYTEFFPGCCWEGFSYSRVVDTATPGPSNQYASFAGGGADGSANYAVTLSGIDAGNGPFISQIDLPKGYLPESIDVTNTTYAALSMLGGDSFSDPFGGLTGDDPDFFRLRIIALDDGSSVGELELFLADYRFADSNQDYIVDTWQMVDLTSLAVSGVDALQLRLDSTDNSQFGMNTPAYVAIDNLLLQSAEPSFVAGDFNRDGIVDAADYTLWRDTLGTLVAMPGDGADADADGSITTDDYDIWRSQFGVQTTANSVLSEIAVPEPSTLLPLFIAVCFTSWRFRS